MNPQQPVNPERIHAATILPIAFRVGDILATLDGQFVGEVGETRLHEGGQIVLLKNATGTILEFPSFRLRASTPDERTIYNANS